tara:strand:- start:2671 stop:3591 length:921 start_codon:yes stop_codon:yes gene_type:complete
MEHPLQFTSNSVKFSFEPENNRLGKLIAEISNVPFPKTEPLKVGEDGIPNITIPNDPAFSTLSKELFALRGTLFLWGVTDIDIDGAEHKWEPETEEERRYQNVFGLKTKREAGNSSVRLPLDMLVRMTVSRDKLLEYEIPCEFYRRGYKDLDKGQYIEAIYDFYFLIEYMWGNGQFKKTAIINTLIKSDLTKFITAALKEPSPKIITNRNDYDVFQSRYFKSDMKKIITHIVDLRGFLHHQSIKRKSNWNPRKNIEFRVDAEFLGTVCLLAMSEIVFKTMFKKSEVDKFLATQVWSGDAKVDWANN